MRQEAGCARALEEIFGGLHQTMRGLSQLCRELALPPFDSLPGEVESLERNRAHLEFARRGDGCFESSLDRLRLTLQHFLQPLLS